MKRRRQRGTENMHIPRLAALGSSLFLLKRFLA